MKKLFQKYIMYNFINMKFWKRGNYYMGKEKDKMVVSQG